MKHHGNVTKINGAVVGPDDVEWLEMAMAALEREAERVVRSVRGRQNN